MVGFLDFFIFQAFFEIRTHFFTPNFYEIGIIQSLGPLENGIWRYNADLNLCKNGKKMNSETEAILRQYVERSGKMFENFGFPRLSGEIGALLYLYNGAMNLDEISEFLSISKGSASTNTRALEKMKFIRVLRVRGDRKDYYEFTGNLWAALKEAIDSFNRNQVDDFKELNKEHVPVLKENKGMDKEDGKLRLHMHDQLKDLNTLYKYIDMLSGMTELFREKPHGVINKTLKKLLSK